MEGKQPTFTVEGTYAPTITNSGTILNLSLKSDISLQSKDKYVLIVLDVSGSMSGGKLKTSKEAISEVIKMLFANSPSPKVDLITFTTQLYIHFSPRKILRRVLIHCVQDLGWWWY